MKTMKTTVTVYKVTVTKAYRAEEIGVGWSLNPWGKNTEYYEGYDDGGSLMELPEGYTYAETKYGTLELYGPDDRRTAIISKQGQPAIITPRGGSIVLKAAKRSET